MAYRENETVYCRFTGEAFTVVNCNGCVASLRDGAGNLSGRMVARTHPRGRLT